MNDQTTEQWAEKVRQTAVSFPYPPTPNLITGIPVAGRQRAPRRRLAWALAVLLLLLAGLLSVPQVRAAVADIFRLGAIRFFVGAEPTPTAAPPPLADHILQSMTAVTLAEVQAALTAPLRLPTYPPNLGPPDDVYVDGATAVFLWRDPAQPAAVRFSLYHIETDDFANKQVELLERTFVNGREAFWAEGPHFFQLANGRVEPWLFVEGSVLIWWAGDVTYRLEGAASLEEAVRMAESLEAVSR